MRGRPYPRRGTPESFGWARVPALDSGGGEAWEMPTGDLILLAPGVRHVVVLVPAQPGAEPVVDGVGAER